MCHHPHAPPRNIPLKARENAFPERHFSNFRPSLTPRAHPVYPSPTIHHQHTTLAMKARQLEKLGIPPSLTKLAKWTASAARQAGLSQQEVRALLAQLVSNPDALRDHEHFGELARQICLTNQITAGRDTAYIARDTPAPWRQWGDDLDANAVQQMAHACQLPIAVAGALMPDAHLGYGLPIGGVLATDNAVIPFAVGVDIACRMKLTVLDLDPHLLRSEPDRLINAIESETRFGMGAEFSGRGKRRDHAVLDEDWNITPITRNVKAKAHAQLGTSGSGNHFVEFGLFTVDDDQARELHLPHAGEYLALLSHSGSRGPGATVADYYSKLAMTLRPNLPRELRHLAWLELDSHEGQEYWHAMQLMGRFAAANHELIHRHIAKHLGASVLLDIENHHNFAWKEQHVINGETREVIVHRKGATPAGRDVLGIIPGSMASPAFIVRGKGNPESLQSASHGAGRVMSRTQARNTYRWSHVKSLLEQRGVHLISAGLDEVPFVYKDIHHVMAQQNDLVQTLARFDPKLVKMAPDGERAED